jgi:PAS domain S-box-containing protein
MYNKLKPKNIKFEEFFRIAFEQNVTPTAIFNLDTTIAMVNDAYCRLSGYTREEVVGMSWTQQLPPDELVRLQEYNRKRLIDPASVPDKYEFAFYTKQGEVKYGYMSVSTLLNLELLVMSFVDITEKKQTELLLAKQIEELKHLIATRDKDLTLIVSHLAGNKEFNDWVLLKLEKLKKLIRKNDKKLLHEIQNLIAEISVLQQAGSWEKLNKHFQVSYPEFISNILNAYPDLTPAEIKLCALLRLNLDTKEIASILNQTFDSIRVSRTRLRKKLNLKAGDNLVTCLMQFK